MERTEDIEKAREKMLARMKELRIERGYSIPQIARKVFLHPDTYARYEKGEREIPLDVLILLARWYGCSLDYLAGVTDSKERCGR